MAVTKKKGTYPAFSVSKRDELCRYLAAGASAKTACAKLGFSYHSYCLWVLKGQAADATEPYLSFVKAVQAAKFEGRTKNPPVLRRGRLPTKLRDEQQESVFEALRLGMNYHEVCKYAGIRNSTFLSWLRLGGHPHGSSLETKPLDPVAIADPYKTFAEKVLALEHGELT